MEGGWWPCKSMSSAPSSAAPSAPALPPLLPMHVHMPCSSVARQSSIACTSPTCACAQSARR
eukprot:634294-Rhodomonas_salina.2